MKLDDDDDPELICAKLYGDADCSGFPMLFGIGHASSDLRPKFEDIGNGVNITVLTRPMCHMNFWSGFNFFGKKETSSGYRWSRSIDGIVSASCYCGDTYYVELLTCEPNEELKPVQECSYSDSSVGGICPYAIDTRHSKWNEEDDDSDESLRYLSPDETKQADLLIGSRVASAMRIPLHELEDVDTTKHLMYATVKPHQAIRISQLLINCGSYVMQIAQPNKWVLNPAAGRLYYFSRESERETRENAASKCKDLGGRLATLARSEEADFAARIVAKNFNDGTTSWWTAAATSEHDEKCWLRWERGGLGNNLHLGPCREDAHCVLIKLFWPSDPVDRFFLIECENQLPFVCEKFLEL